MPEKPRHNPNSTEPLPGSFEADLRRLDDRLACDLERFGAPPGLADRVFAASVERLPARRLRFVPADETSETRRRRSWRRLSWGRVALAASVGLAGAIALRMLQSPATPPSAPDVAAVSPGFEALLPAGTATDDLGALALSPDTESLLLGFMGEGDDDLSYLAVTRDLTLDDLSSEMFAMLADLNQRDM